MDDKEAAVPKFGEWNDRDATPPNNYTAIFTRVREERQEQGARAPTLPRNVNSPSNQNHEHQQRYAGAFHGQENDIVLCIFIPKGLKYMDK